MKDGRSGGLGCGGGWVYIQEILSRILRSGAHLRARSGIKANQARYFRDGSLAGHKPSYSLANLLRFFADRAAKKWPLRGTLKYAGVLLAYPPSQMGRALCIR